MGKRFWNAGKLSVKVFFSYQKRLLVQPDEFILKGFEIQQKNNESENCYLPFSVFKNNSQHAGVYSFANILHSDIPNDSIFEVCTTNSYIAGFG